MNLAIFGASGRTGRELVRQALERGHLVKAFARTPDKIEQRHECLQIIAGDVRDEGAVEQALVGVDGVLSVLGPTANEPDDQVTRGTSTIIEVMERQGPQRIIISAGAGVSDPRDRPNLLNRVIKGILLLAARHVFDDMSGAVAAARSSDLDWTVVRVPRLTDEAPVERIRQGYLPDVGIRVGRADLASFMLDQLESDEWMKASPVISS